MLQQIVKVYIPFVGAYGPTKFDNNRGRVSVHRDIIPVLLERQHALDVSQVHLFYKIHNPGIFEGFPTLPCVELTDYLPSGLKLATLKTYWQIKIDEGKRILVPAGMRAGVIDNMVPIILVGAGNKILIYEEGKIRDSLDHIVSYSPSPKSIPAAQSGQSHQTH